MTDVMYGKEYIVKVTDDGECITVGELIRCKNCKWNSNNNNWVDCMISEMYGRNATDNYCSRAEPKDKP